VTGRAYHGLHRLLLVQRSDSKYVATLEQASAHALVTQGTPMDLFGIKQSQTDYRKRFLTPHHSIQVTPVEETDVTRKPRYALDSKLSRHILRGMGGDVPPTGYDDLVLRAIVGHICDAYHVRVKLFRKEAVEEIAVAFVLHAFGCKPFMTHMDAMEEEVRCAEENPLYVVHDLFSALQVSENTFRALQVEH
jgi:hypothetical protein